MSTQMTVPLWCVIGFVLWIVMLVLGLTFTRMRHLRAGGSHRDFGVPDDRRIIWRLYRAHLNALENFPLFASVVLVAAVRGVGSWAFDVLALAYLAARVGQSVVHVLPGAGLPGNTRFGFYAAQLACLVALALLALGGR